MNFLWENLFRTDTKSKNIQAKLKENILFRNLAPREIRFIEQIIHERHYRAGETVFRQGDIGVGMYIVAKGSIDIFVTERDTENPEVIKENFVTRLIEDDFFGELSLVEENGRRSATSIAHQDTILLGFFKPDLLSILERNPATGVKVVFRLAEVLGRRLRDTTEKISSLRSGIKTTSQERVENPSADPLSPGTS